MFMPVGTHATVKGVTTPQLRELNSQVVLANTYHLYMRPGVDIIEKAGGVQKFMNYDGPMLTDSGGFQLFSLDHMMKTDPDASHSTRAITTAASTVGRPRATWTFSSASAPTL